MGPYGDQDQGGSYVTRIRLVDKENSNGYGDHNAFQGTQGESSRLLNPHMAPREISSLCRPGQDKTQTVGLGFPTAYHFWAFGQSLSPPGFSFPSVLWR